jgi:hypothetical protein
VCSLGGMKACPIPSLSPSLWFSPPAIEAARGRHAAGDKLSLAVMAKARIACCDTADPNFVGGAAAVALIDQDRLVAERLADHLISHPAISQDLGFGHYGMQLAVASACCHALWDEARMALIRSAAAAVVRRLRHAPSSHNPHAVQNNWWAITHSGALLAALVAHPASDHHEDIRWALGRLRAFCQHFGDAGLYHEGLGYQMYTLSHLLPALTAADALGLFDLRRDQPWIARLAESLYICTSPRPAMSDSTGPAQGHGMMLSWNDAGLAWGSFNISPLMLAYAEPERQPALAAWFAGLEGPDVPQSTCCAAWEGWPFALVFNPLADHNDAGPGGLRTHVTDRRQGLAVFRDRWQDGNDAVLGAYARTTQIGGHSQDDGGSVRFMAEGHDWVIGGGQARGEACWQSIVMPTVGDPKRKAGLGAVIWDEETPEGGTFAMDLRKVSQAYHERYVAMHRAEAGRPTCLAMLDLIDDHLDRAWTWRATCEPGLQVLADDDGGGFLLIAADGKQAHWRFLGQRPLRLRMERTPDSRRTFSNGVTTDYPGRPVIAADFPPTKHLAIYAVLTVAASGASSARLAQGVAVEFSGSVWERPFLAAVPAAYDLLQGGTLSRWADGGLGR